jgi:outer membrane protein OmpA-like peptidoglycan-associated protein
VNGGGKYLSFIPHIRNSGIYLQHLKQNIIAICFILFSILLLTTLKSNSDTIYWADKVVGYSSQTGNKEYSAFQILGKPSIMPYQGISATAWMPKFPTDKIEWIRVKYPEKIFVKQIIINENLNPGSIVKIILYDSLNQGHLVYSNNLVSPHSSPGRLNKIKIEPTDFRTNELKIEVNLINYLDNYQIDAIGIADFVSDFDLKINYKPDTLNFEKEQLDTNINSRYRELAPIISQDGRNLVFTREGHPDNVGIKKRQDVWISKIDSIGKFKPAENLGSPINNENANFAISVSTNANSIFLGNIYLPDGNTRVGFSISRFNGVGWDNPDSLIIKNYYNLYPTGSACLANNEKILITSVKREDSFGKTDLYVSFLQDDGSWSEPRNLGGTVNSSEEELSPFLAGDNKTLYFSSAGFPGFGSNDMFITRRLDDSWKKWSEPQNLGDKINSDGWDAYYSVTANGKYAYFVSSLNKENTEDIFRIELPVEIKPDVVVLISGRVLNQKTNQPVAANIKYEILPEGFEAGIAKSNPLTGEYSIVLPAGKMYGFLATSDSCISINENIDLKNIVEYCELNRDLLLAPIEKGQVIRINNIFFEYNEYELLSESFSELNRIVKVLNENPKIKILIQGHTDNIGNDVFNNGLSLNRSESVFNYLVNNGIDASRLKIKGYGRTKPIAKNDTDESRAKNRRVEFVILEK